MIIGKGMIARAFSYYENNELILIYASGVSNSKETNIESFEREKYLIEKNIRNNSDKIFVYFSTCSIEDESLKDSAYVKHKIRMEQIIKNNCNKFFIFRLPQVVGIGKSPTIINFFVNSIINNSYFEVYKNASRNLIDVDDVFMLAQIFIEKELYQNETINLATPYNVNVIDIVSKLEILLSKKGIYKIIDLGKKQNIEISIIESLGIKFKENYIDETLSKYIMSYK